MTPFVVIHAGAGYHSPKNEKEYKRLVTSVVNSTLEILYQGASAERGVEHAIALLESHPLTNAGIHGSNLCIDGSIQVDASIITETGMASIGAVPMVTDEPLLIHQNPISIAFKLLESNSKGVDRAGRQPPVLLVGSDAHLFAQENGMDMMTSTKEMLSVSQLETYYHHLGILKKSTQQDSKYVESDLLSDTVGAVVIDVHGKMASGVSSGGISLKNKGRVGEAAIPGSGLYILSDDVKIGCSISGTGEQIMRTFMASAICNALHEDPCTEEALKKVIEKRFLDSEKLKNERMKNIGVIVVKQEQDYRECYWAHTTASFCIGFGSKIGSAKFKMSRKHQNKKLVIAGQPLKS